MTPLSDKAIAQAWREAWTPSDDAGFHAVVQFNTRIANRAREIDAASHGEDEARVERAAKAIWVSGQYETPWDELYQNGKEVCRQMARAAIAASASGGEG